MIIKRHSVSYKALLGDLRYQSPVHTWQYFCTVGRRIQFTGWWVPEEMMFTFRNTINSSLIEN